MKAIQDYIPSGASCERLGTLHCKCHYPVPVSVSYDILPDSSKVSGHLYDSSDDFVDAGSAALVARSKHKDGLVLTTKHGAWLIKPTRIIGSGELVEFESLCRVELEIGFKPVTVEEPEMEGVKTVGNAEFQVELESTIENVKLHEA